MWLAVGTQEYYFLTLLAICQKQSVNIVSFISGNETNGLEVLNRILVVRPFSTFWHPLNTFAYHFIVQSQWKKNHVEYNALSEEVSRCVEIITHRELKCGKRRS